MSDFDKKVPIHFSREERAALENIGKAMLNYAGFSTSGVEIGVHKPPITHGETMALAVKLLQFASNDGWRPNKEWLFNAIIDCPRNGMGRLLMADGSKPPVTSLRNKRSYMLDHLPTLAKDPPPLDWFESEDTTPP